MRLLLYLLVLPFLQTCKTTINASGTPSAPPSHAQFTTLLQKNVDAQGLVNYQGFLADSALLVDYLNAISQAPPATNWTKNEQLATYINMYNGYTILVVLRNMPINSIKDISPSVSIPFVNTVWDAKFFKIGDQPFSLNDIEHGTIRKTFKDPRVHFALNCASISCPKLLNQAYEASTLNQQLDSQAVRFINDAAANQITAEEAHLSKIFFWYKTDFTQKMDFVDFINQYATTKITKNTKIDYLDYLWNLNTQTNANGEIK